MISIRHLHKYFNKGAQNEIHVLNDLNLELPEKGMVAIFGRSGCGKTTLLNVIGGLDGYASGSLTLEGRSIKAEADTLRNSHMGYIFQNYNLHKTETCYSNVAAALRLCGMTDEGEIETRVIAALTNVGMEKYKNRTPDTLSGGQQQRIAIARAIVKNPRIILADEPTGNLDEANTVMIMDLLKAIAKDHLVILVTHEANLVDHYCDTVIELTDGRVTNIRENDSADGFAARDKNDIYLGELEKTSASTDTALIECYGDKPETPVKLTVIHKDGKIYLKIDTPKVQILDDTSEIKLRRGVFVENKKENRVSEAIDMSALPPITGKRFGKLFTLRSSLKSGFRANFKKGKKGKTALFIAMISFAMVLVMMTAIFGTSIGTLLEADKSYNHNVFYLYTPEGWISDRLLDAYEKGEHGIDGINMTQQIPYYNPVTQLSFTTGYFETYEGGWRDYNFSANGVFLDSSLIKGKTPLAGTTELAEAGDAIITTAVADELLSKSTYSYLEDYADLIGMRARYYTVANNGIRIVGVVESEEKAFYLSPVTMANISMEETRLITFDHPDAESLKAGETVLFVKNAEELKSYPKAGDTVTLRGKTFTVKNLVAFWHDYPTWLKENGIKKQSMEDFFAQKMKEAYPDLTREDPEYEAKFREVRGNTVYLWYDHYAAEFDRFLDEFRTFQPENFEVWLAAEKDILPAKFLYFSCDMLEGAEVHEWPEGYYRALRFKAEKGRYPTYEEALKLNEKGIGYYEDLEEYMKLYQEEFYKFHQSGNPYSYQFIVSKEDYISLSKRVGNTYTPNEGGEYYGYSFSVIHSSDPEKTEAFLKETFSTLPDFDSQSPALLTPTDVYNNLIAEELVAVISGLVTMAVILVLLSICMYFIMRSSLMNRIKEVGIWRAIGVSKKNLVFRFFVEATLLTTLTVLIGYLAASAFIYLCMSISAAVSTLFFYPTWLALTVLAVLYGICTLCGVAPILSLLRKTPAQILAKYDI